MRLATNFAPDWDVETQYTKLLQSGRFDHYIKLVAVVQNDIKNLEKDEKYLIPKVGDMIITARDGYVRNYNLALAQSPVLSVTNITATSADFSWNEFDVKNGKFNGYYLLVNPAEFYDPFVDGARIPINKAKFITRKLEIS